MPSATIVRSGSHGEEEFHSVAGSPLLPPDEHHDDSEAVAFDAPIHPVKTLQGSFEESIVESADDHDGSDSVNGSAESRRQTLLEAKKYDESWQTRWKQRATARYHPLLKLIAQIVFGMHLLQQQQAKSEGEVVKILQAHVNEVDTFLEKTAEDFDLANNDIQERIRHLKLPMEHRDVFEVMLDDKKFRSQLLDGNDKIESIIDRTTKAMDASMYDLNEGIKANGELGKYLDGVSGRWPKDKRVIAEVFGAMRGNEQGWTRYIADLQLKAKTLKQNLAQLTTLLGEMSRMAAVASRRNISQRTRTTSSVGSKSAPTSPGLRSKFPEDEAPPVPSSPPRSVRSTKSSKSLKDVNKPLPRDPSAGASKSTSRNHAVPMADRFDRSRQMPLSQDTSRTPLRPSVQAERPRTAGGISSKKAREADHRENTADLAAFLKQAGGAPQRSAAPQHHNPLRSNPPDEEWADLERSQSHPNGQAAGQSARSRSQGGIDIMKGAEQARSQMGLKSRDSTSTSRTSSDQGVDKKGNLVGLVTPSSLQRNNFALTRMTARASLAVSRNA